MSALSRRASVAVALGTTIALSRHACAQLPIDDHTRVLVPAGFETEQYLRALQVAGIAPQYPWSVRAFGVDELRRITPSPDSTHPWAQRFHHTGGSDRVYLLAPSAQLFYNTTLPYGDNDGPLWQGRGLTADVQFGFGASIGPVSLVVAPEAFRSENRTFPLIANGQSGNLRFANPVGPLSIDYPQRFGDRAYQQLSFGQSTLRVAEGPIAIGISTANEYWGPAAFNPAILGNNAAGFPHLFAGTSHPVDLWLFKIHGRAIWGRLDQSDYSLIQTGEKRRFAPGLVGIIEPRGVPGLEIGAARFFHRVWPDSGFVLTDFTDVFSLKAFSDSKRNSQGLLDDNQLGSIFFRWAFPGAGLEAYGEYAREDYNNNIYDVLSEPDHDAAYTVGIQHTIRRGTSLVVVKAEVTNARMTRLATVRPQTPFYVHSPIVQGHTEDGQILGSPALLGGAGANIAADIYSPSGRWAFRLNRTGVDQSRLSNFYGLTAERLWFRRHADIRVAATQAVQINRNPGQDVGNLNLQIGTLLHW